jgi:hypothetical protein
LYAWYGWKINVLDKLIAIIKSVIGIHEDLGKLLSSSNKLNIIVRSIGHRTILAICLTAAQVGEWSTYIKVTRRDGSKKNGKRVKVCSAKSRYFWSNIWLLLPRSLRIFTCKE